MKGKPLGGSSPGALDEINLEVHMGQGGNRGQGIDN